MNNFDAIETAYQNEQWAAEELRRLYGNPAPSNKPTIRKICKCGQALRLFQVAPDDTITEIDESQVKMAWFPTWAASAEDIQRATPTPGAFLFGPEKQLTHDIHCASCDPIVETLLHIGRCQKAEEA